MKLVIYSDDRDARDPITRTAKMHGFDLHVATGKYRWYKDLETRTKSTMDLLKTFDPEEIVVVSDGHDVYIQGDAVNFLSVYNRYYSGKIVFQSEKTNWPDPRLIRKCVEKFTDMDGYSFLCFGMHAGPAGKIVEMYEKGLRTGVVDDELKHINPHLNWAFDDQLFAALEYVVNDDLVVDGQCLLAQTLQPEAHDDLLQYEDGSIRNSKKNTRPIFIHGNGSVNVKRMYEDVMRRYVYRKEVSDLPV